jgi:hypothetical protein
MNCKVAYARQLLRSFMVKTGVFAITFSFPPSDRLGYEDHYEGRKNGISGHF